MRATQFTILQALSLTGELPQRRLGALLAIDSTSLTRALSIVIRLGWIAERRGEDRRERWLRLADAGQEAFQRASPAWVGVQSRLREQLGDGAWNGLLEATRHVAGVATELSQQDQSPQNEGGSI
jgi:DNA-binding MarR family transcriptional regulator